MGIKVIATAKGFYDGRIRYPEDDESGRKPSVFEIKSEKDFSSNWMKKLDGRSKEASSFRKEA